MDSKELSKFEDSDSKLVKKLRSTKLNLKDDIEEMMFGFGDKWPPNPETVDLVEDLVINYIQEISFRSLQIAEIRGKFDKECFLFVVRKDRPKFTRVCRLLKANEELKAAQKVDMTEDGVVLP
jgi:transcription initiation factor TFIID subunit 13